MIRWIFILCLISVSSALAQDANNVTDISTVQNLISPKKAMLIAESSPEVAALYALDNQRFVNCIEKKVVKPCDSGGWVTCVDNAWVVEFIVGETCAVKNDGRLNEMMLVDGKDGKIISRFPEVSYYTEAQYCQIDKDCMTSPYQEGKAVQCLNFVYGQINEEPYDGQGPCICQEGHCVLPKQ